MDKTYVETVRLLLAATPDVFRAPHFELKGGTALNLFVQEMPRLSVDLDAVYVPHATERGAALEEIGKTLATTREQLSTSGIASEIISTKDGDDVKLLIRPRPEPGEGRSEPHLSRHRATDRDAPAGEKCARFFPPPNSPLPCWPCRNSMAAGFADARADDVALSLLLRYRAGSRTSGTSGSRTSGSRTSGSRTSGSQTSGSRTSGSRTSVRV